VGGVGVFGKLVFEGMMKVFIFHPVCNWSHFGKYINTGCFDLVWWAIFGMPTVPCVICVAEGGLSVVEVSAWISYI